MLYGIANYDKTSKPNPTMFIKTTSFHSKIQNLLNYPQP
jgi:hypothetical protein